MSNNDAPPPIHYDESLIPPYTLPEPLISDSGETIDTEEKWFRLRRPEILAHFETDIYGRMPDPLPFEAVVVEESQEALSGTAIRRQVELRFVGAKGPTLGVLLYLPKAATGPVPCFLGLNFFGNHACTRESEVFLNQNWMRPDGVGIVDERATEASRGVLIGRWPMELILSRGYGLATVYYGDIDPDFDDGFKNGVHPLFRSAGANPDGDAPAAISAWAWGLSRIMDFLETVREIDPKRVCLTGHSRLGKTALWAAACDERFALVVSNNAGCGGPALTRRNYGETMTLLTHVRPYWFCANANARAHDLHSYPVDQHQLIALIAPRPVLISSKEDDQYADPKGEYLGGYHAGEVYRLLGCEGLPSSEMPALNKPVLTRVGASYRPGGHGITPEDWAIHLDFADHHLGT